MRQTRWLLAMALAMPLCAHAQTRTTSGEVVQATPSAEAVNALNRNLSLLSRNPQDVQAMLGAGQAALDLGDIQAANGFYTRANMVNPSLGKAKLGLAIVEIALRQPAEAAANFDAAAALGESAQGHLADRGLAYDLTGQQQKAQRDYQAALQANPADETARLRLGASLGISGHISESDAQLEQALSAGNREAWRIRAFVLAMNGRLTEARRITQTVMPRGLAESIDPYMQRLPLLTAAQKAAALHYGEFPSNVLQMDPPAPGREREVQVASGETDQRAEARRERRRSSSERLTAQSQTRRTSERNRRAAQQAPAASPPPAAAPPPAGNVELAAAETRTPPPPSPSPPARAAPAPASPPPATVDRQGPADPQPQPQVDRAPPPLPPAAAPPPEVQQPSLAEAMAGVSIPAAERAPTTVRADMSAVQRIQEQRRQAEAAAAARARAEQEARAERERQRREEAERRAKLAANPARIWVQIATGRDIDALGFDLRRMRRTYSDAIADEDGWIAEWGQTRRLLVGPYRKMEDARAAVNKITGAGGDAFIWQSEAGEEVTKVGGR